LTEFKEYIEYINAAAVVIASLIAIYGINSWRREYRGKKQAELAEEALCLFYEAQDDIRHIRSPFAGGHEGKTRKVNDSETPEQKEAYDKAYVLIERYKTYIRLFNKLHAMRYRFMAQFGIDAGKPFEDFRKILNEITTSADILPQLWAENNNHYRNENQEKEHREFVNKLENVFWEQLPKNDTIKPRVKKCIEDIEAICRPIIDNKSWLKLTIENIKGKASRSLTSFFNGA